MDYAHACLLRKQTSGLQFLVIYVNSMNLIDTLEEIKKTTKHLKSEFEIKKISETKSFSRPGVIQSANGILVHQSNYI